VATAVWQPEGCYLGVAKQNLARVQPAKPVIMNKLTQPKNQWITFAAGAAAVVGAKLLYDSYFGDTK